jgi:hypothetical protein
MANRTRAGVFQKMAAGHDRVHCSHQLRALGDLEQRRVVANTQNHTRLEPRRVADEEAANQLKLAETGRLRHAQSAVMLSLPGGRTHAAAIPLRLDPARH